LVPTGLVISSNLITPHNAIASNASVGAPWLDDLILRRLRLHFVTV